MSAMVQTEEKTRVLDLGQVIEHRCMAECFEQLDGADRKLIWILDGRTGKVRLGVYADVLGSDEIDAPLLCAPGHGWEPFDCPEKDCDGCPGTKENAA